MRGLGWVVAALMLAGCSGNDGASAVGDGGTGPKLVFRPTLTYPPTLLAAGKEAEVHLRCVIQADGGVRNCGAPEVNGDPALGAAAVAFIEQSRYQPATAGGVAVAVAHTFRVNYVLVPRTLVMPYLAAGLTVRYPPVMREEQREGQVVVSCDIGTDGLTSNCTVRRLIGDKAFVPAALEYARVAEFRPASVDGTPVPITDHWIAVNFLLDADRNRFPPMPPETEEARGVDIRPTDVVVGVECQLEINGTTTGCTVERPTHSKTLDAKALAIASASHVPPLKLDGTLVPEPHLRFFLDFGAGPAN